MSNYDVSIMTSEVELSFRTDDPQTVFALISQAVSTTIQSESEPCEIESTILKVQNMLREQDEAKNNRLTPISRAGIEPDIIRCYLEKMTIDETVAHIKDNCDFEVSSSAVGRYWERFRELSLHTKFRR